jgi:CRAL/TRIO domain
VYCFGKEEGEAFALCRWLRARKFDYAEVIKMVEQATKARAEAKSFDFYTDPKAALGCDMSVYFAQYPQLYSGFAKNGCPVFISKPGVLNVDAVECITTLLGIVKFHWYIMMHDFGGRLRAQKAKDPHFKRFECFCVLDLEHLTMGQLNSRTMEIIKEQSAIDSLCFPETMNKMMIVNGPRFFGATWSIIKGFLDPRTSSKIEVISSKKTWQKRLLEFIDAEQLPVDYGGTGPDTQVTMDKENFSGKMKRIHTELMFLRYVYLPLGLSRNVTA